MIVSENMKVETLKKLNSLLKCYLVNTFENIGYEPNAKNENKERSKRAKLILATIENIKQDKEITKENLTTLFDMYRTYTYRNGGLWEI